MPVELNYRTLVSGEINVSSNFVDFYIPFNKIVLIEEKAMKQKVIFYEDELNDEFAGDSIVPRKIDESYIYIPKGIWKRFTHFFWYRLVATPLAYLYLKLKFHHKIINKSALKPFRGDSYFLYGNHTHFMADALIPSMISFPKHTYVIVHANNVSMPVLGRITPSLGAIPLPDDGRALKNFTKCIERRIEEKRCITIYPEAHIWPYYTKIRAFPSLSFSYPIHYQKPVFCFTNVYLKRRLSRNPKMVTYIDGPFYPDTTLPVRQQREELRNRVYTQMTERSRLNTVEIIKYIPKGVEE